ncbi:hypothetical protein [Noviherbaspirillum denitrificans]|uniref:Uncharacterized protein n=1 Tax=Noviherbaspirillum denitrificans TaxID=1968433 RepID=A0A254T9M8_9BURK|nr:hypothetical protein [Noviherbaspirillum denitrificans]OWW19285.1 hypothetical protein AYR66_07010 [Noviherbaspirillum denitrificans]
MRLVNGDIWVVTGRGIRTTTQIVHALVGTHGEPLSYPIRSNTNNELHVIREVLHESQAGVRINLQQLWGKDAAP